MKKITLILTILLSSVFGFGQTPTNITDTLISSYFNTIGTTLNDTIQLNGNLTITSNFPGPFTLYGLTYGTIAPLVASFATVPNLAANPHILVISRDTTILVKYATMKVWINVKVDLTTSIKNIETTQNFNIYPNPVVNTLNIDIDNYDGDFQVFDMTGKTLIQTTDKSIDVSKLNSGNYLLRFGTTTKVFVKN